MSYNPYEAHIHQMADDLMAAMARDAIYDGIKNVLFYDRNKPAADQQFKELYFLIDGTGTKDPEGWVFKALSEFDTMKAAGWDVPANAPPILKILWVKKYRKELQNLRKAHGGKMPTEEEVKAYYNAKYGDPEDKK